MPAILRPVRRQVNAKGLLREVHAAEEGVEAGVGVQAELQAHQRLWQLGSHPQPGPKLSRSRRPRNLMIFKVVIVQDWG